MRSTALISVVFFAGAVPVLASDPILGTWLSPPDTKGQTGHLVMSECGVAFCGTMVETFDAAGNPVTLKSTGREMIWDMVNEGGGRYGGGKVWIPSINQTLPADLKLDGTALTVHGCLKVALCRSQVWHRID